MPRWVPYTQEELKAIVDEHEKLMDELAKREKQQTNEEEEE